METKPSRINEARAVEALASLYVRVAVSLLNIPLSLRPSYEMRGTRMSRIFMCQRCSRSLIQPVPSPQVTALHSGRTSSLKLWPGRQGSHGSLHQIRLVTNNQVTELILTGGESFVQ